MRLFITGTDTDVGKTRIAAAVARALVERALTPTIVKLVQTGIAADEPGDAAIAASLAGCPSLELARFSHPADPWSAALDAGAEPLAARSIASRLETIAGPIVAEGSGGAAVPLNARETLTLVAAQAECEAVVVVGLRLGCINHTLLTLAYLRAHRVPVRGAVLVERWGPTASRYHDEVRRALEPHVPSFGVVPHDPDQARSVARAAPLFRSL